MSGVIQKGNENGIKLSKGHSVRATLKVMARNLKHRAEIIFFFFKCGAGGAVATKKLVQQDTCMSENCSLMHARAIQLSQRQGAV